MRTWIPDVVRLLATLLLGLYAGGVFFVVIAPTVGRLDGAAYVRYWQAMNVDMGRAMPPFMLGCLALLVVTCAFSYRRGWLVFSLAAAATLLVVVTIALTITQLEPLNRLADGWDPLALPADWAEVRARWQSLHLVRTVIAVVALVTMLASSVAERLHPAG
jgi:hypothetical protein